MQTTRLFTLPHRLAHIRWEWVIVGALILGLASLALLPASRSAAQEEEKSLGMICTSNPTATFHLRTEDGSIQMTDGNTVYMWSYADVEGELLFEHPGPILCVNQGDTVTIVLENTLPVATSIVFPGQTDVRANGEPSQPQFDEGGNLVSLAQEAAPMDGRVTYQFVAGEPGTYLYHSGTQPLIQTQMGLFGAIVVRPAGFPDRVYNDPLTQFNVQQEYLLFLSDVDPLMHEAIQRGEPFDMTNFTPRYWLINGREFPDTVAPNFASWIPNQPYSSIVRIHPYDSINNPLPALVRYVSVMSEDVDFHPHGNHSRVIGRDGRLLRGPAQQDLSYEKFLESLGPSQTWDVLFVWQDAESWDPVTNPVPVPIPGETATTLGEFYSGSPYLGDFQEFPTGQQTYNQCGEYYHMAHNHDLDRITSWGLTMRGQATYTRVDPPLPNNCPY